MAYFYTNTRDPDAPQLNVWKMNGTKAYLRHYDNYLFLDFVSKNPRASDREKRQARLELTICEQKLSYWRKHPNYDEAEAQRGVQGLKHNWSAA
ncbi:MAG: hypothetical protein EOQ56_28070 [Mesorhizobium sp.]|nr:MAG: hypothetical protein EOQ56_28070 [Mesorhizobium sp.]